MASVKAVYVMTDMEGVAGIDAWDPRFEVAAGSLPAIYESRDMLHLLTAEVNAAILGLQDAGVEDIVVCDGHGSGRNLVMDELVPGARIVRGIKRSEWLPKLDSHFGGLVQVGMHSMSNTPHGNLAHTMSTDIEHYQVNGHNVGEMELAAYLAGDHGVPWLFTSGDLHACREAESWVPGIVTAAVKEGLSELCAVHLPPAQARQLIRERVRLAVQQAANIKPLVAQPPVTLEIRRRKPGPDRVGPGGVRLDAFTVSYTGDSISDVFYRATYA